VTTWRQCSKVPHHIFWQRGPEPDNRAWPDGDPPVATFLNPADAAMAVVAVNRYGDLLKILEALRAEGRL
jgi:hypothetical protein